MTDSNASLEPWHCPGSGQPPVSPSELPPGAHKAHSTNYRKCRGCGKVRSLRYDGNVPLHPRPGMYHPNKQPKQPRVSGKSRLAAIETAYAEYEAALNRREHGGVAAARFIEAVAAALNGGAA